MPRTDLAIEAITELAKLPPGIEQEEDVLGNVVINRIKISNKQEAERIGKSIGTYITIQVPPFGDNGGFDDDVIIAIKKEISTLLPKEGLVLVVGLGNTQITPDALGPRTADRVLATRHISGEIARSIGLEGLRSVAVISPGVLGRTGIESSEIVKGLAQRVNPVCAICIDALAAQSIYRLGNTIQISNTGISPGSGVGNKRLELSKETLSTEVISIGVPTVVDADIIINELANKQIDNVDMIVTPREIDLMIDRASELLGHAINCALQPNISSDILKELV